MREYELIAETTKEAQRASTVVDSIMDRDSGQIALFYRLEDGKDVPYIDTGYLNQRGLQRIRRRYRVVKRGA